MLYYADDNAAIEQTLPSFYTVFPLKVCRYKCRIKDDKNTKPVNYKKSIEKNLFW